ncbi:MAG: thermitase [Gaiellaceae bacterium]|nr:thermitase [Gaiellaceae bacterium]
MLRRVALVMLGATVLAPAAAAAPYTLVKLNGGGAFMGEPLLRAAGAEEISPSLSMWRVRTAATARLLPALRGAGIVSLVQPERVLVRAAARATAVDPLVSAEWWLADVGADRAVAPGPGVPVTVVDTGIDLNHPEFAGRPNTTALNTQRVSDSFDDFHGTAVASVVAAPENGVGLVGVYPQAALRVYDADLTGGLTDADAIRGIEAAANAGPGVINLSFGSVEPDVALQDEIYSVFRRGSIVVAASGNSRDEGNPINFPANMSHVLTVAASDHLDHAAFFSSSSAGVDLAAPGVDIEAAVPVSFNVNGYDSVDGTSFSAPIVSGATAWVWTVRADLKNTQVFDLMRWSARDVGVPGFDEDTGFGILDIPNALALTAPPVDPQEPNDDIYLVRPGGLFRTGGAPVTSPGHGTASVKARLDFTEDPEDVYRVWVPAHKIVTVSTHASDNVDLEVWRSATRSVGESGAAAKRDLAAASAKKGTATDSVAVKNGTARGAYYYADVFPGAKVGDATYTLNVTTRASAKR